MTALPPGLLNISEDANLYIAILNIAKAETGKKRKPQEECIDELIDVADDEIIDDEIEIVIYRNAISLMSKSGSTLRMARDDLS